MPIHIWVWSNEGNQINCFCYSFLLQWPEQRNKARIVYWKYLQNVKKIELLLQRGLMSECHQILLSQLVLERILFSFLKIFSPPLYIKDILSNGVRGGGGALPMQNQEERKSRRKVRSYRHILRLDQMAHDFNPVTSVLPTWYSVVILRLLEDWWLRWCCQELRRV